MNASWAVAPHADPHMSQNAPRPARPPTSLNSDRATGAYDHYGWHPERIRRSREFASCNRSAQLPLFLELGNALLFITIDGRWDTLSMKAKRLIKER